MFYITNQAKQELSKLYTESEHDPDDYLRLSNGRDDELGLNMAHRQANDESLEYDGKTILVFEPAVVSHWHDVSVDAYDTPEGTRIIISREEMQQSHPSVTVNWINLPRVPNIHN